MNCEKCKKEVPDVLAKAWKEKYNTQLCKECLKVHIKELKEKNKYTIKLQGKDYLTHHGLLAKAHEIGLKSIVVELVLELCSAERYVSKCVVTMKDGGVFVDYGDADKTNVNKNIVPHILRMSNTRAENRALRLAIGDGRTSIEELGGKDE